MTAIRSFPNAPLAQRHRPLLGARLISWAEGAWQALQRVNHGRAAWELEVLADRRASTDPGLARQLRTAAQVCRRAAEDVAIQQQGSRS